MYLKFLGMYYVDYLLDRLTMYRLVLYYLIALLLIAGILGFFGVLSYSPLSILLGTLLLVCISYITNYVFSYVFKAPTNVESVYITALILACIIAPIRNYHDLPMYVFAAVLAISSKYILAFKKKHFFNPVAIAVVLTAYGFGQSANWWIGTAVMMPAIIIGGFLVVYKTRRWDMVFTFLAVALSTIALFGLAKGTPMSTIFKQSFLQSSLFFFAFVMLTEPLTTPPTKGLQMFYGGLVGLLFPPQIHLFDIYSTPELALVIGNFFSYLVSPKQKLLLKVKEKFQIAPDIMDFVFKPPSKFAYQPGQYLEWTLRHPKTDSRGNRRYFTLASSPTEDTLRIGVKFYPGGSSYKRSLQTLTPEMPIMAGQLAGDFTLPKDKSQKLVFVAGGIGVTPFRSMLKYLLDTKEHRDIIVLYSNKYADEIVYTDVLQEAAEKLGMRTVYTLTDVEKIPQDWQGERGRISGNLITRYIPDWKERIFYLSGPHVMVVGFEKTLKEMGVSRGHIKKDFFPGFV